MSFQNKIHFMEVNIMEKMLKRDTTGECEGECRDRVFEGEEERQHSISSQPYNEPSPKSPSWAKSRKEQPGVYGGRV
ncbi:MAG: hypothetical protein WCA42_07560 [Desulfobacterales bacterium]